MDISKSALDALSLETFFAEMKEVNRTSFKPPSKLSILDWAEQRYVMSSEYANEAGKYSTKRAHYQKGILEAIGDPRAKEVVLMTSSQVGKSIIQLITLGYYMEQNPSPILMVLPDKQMGERVSTQRLSPMIDDSGMKHLVTNDTKTMKTFKGGSIRIASAGVSTDLQGDSIRILLLDEVDGFEANVGNRGDPVELAIQRTTTYPDNKKIIITSTPKIKNLSKIESAYDNSNQGVFHHKCVHCSELFAPTWDLVKWNIVDDEPDPLSALLYCPHCGCGHTDPERNKSVRNGEWIAKYPQRATKGFYLNVLSSPWVKTGEIAQKFIKAQGDAFQMQKFWNENLGLPFEIVGERFDDMQFDDRLEDYDRHNIPDEVLFLTAGVDTQLDRVEAVVYGWGKDFECWVVDYFVVSGSPADISTWKQLHNELQEPYTRQDKSTVQLKRVGIDTGGNFGKGDQGFSTYVHKFCREHGRYGYMPFKGASSDQKTIFPSNKRKIGKTYLIDTWQAKSMFFGNLKRSKVGAGYIHFYRGLDDEFFKQLTSEQRVLTKHNGLTKVRWEPIGNARHEVLDCTVYALAARLSLSHTIEKATDLAKTKVLEKIEDSKKEINEKEEPNQISPLKNIINTTPEPEIKEMPPPKPPRVNPRFKQQYRL